MRLESWMLLASKWAGGNGKVEMYKKKRKRRRKVTTEDGE